MEYPVNYDLISDLFVMNTIWKAVQWGYSDFPVSYLK